MKSSLFRSILLALIPLSVQAHTFTLTDTTSNIERGNWQIDSTHLGIKSPVFRIEQTILHGGRQEGSKLLTITSPSGLTIVLSPTRGMGLLRVTGDGVRLGWDSPVKEVVNPSMMTLDSQNGLGWLEGFNEMLVRCGYAWTGHPVTDKGILYTLHGRAENTPASTVTVTVEDHAPYRITVRGLIKEETFKKSHLQTWTELSYVPGTRAFAIHDILTNTGDYPQDYQIIYHSNFGPPLLEKGAHVIAAVKEISPFNRYAQKGLATWQSYPEPTSNFDEMVFNLVPYTDSLGKTEVALINKAGDRGVSIAFDTHQLPLLTLWKNTDTLHQGYVTGLEPGTNYAYPVTIERAQGRVRQIGVGKSLHFDLTYTLLNNATAVNQSQARIGAIQGHNPSTTQHAEPLATE